LSLILLALVKLRAHRGDPQPRHAVGASVLRADEAASSQPLEQVERAVRQDVSLACETGDFADLTLVAPFIVDSSTKGEFVQNTLFVL